MKKLFLIILTLAMIACTSNIVQAQMHKKSWSSYYQQLRPNDPFLQINFAPPNHNMAKSWNDLSGKERRRVKRHLKYHYDIKPSFGGYLVGTLETVSGSVFRTAVYIITLGATAIIVGAILNNPPR